MNKFNVGDMVRLSNPSDEYSRHLSHRAHKVTHADSDQTIKVENDSRWYSDARFVKAEQSLSKTSFDLANFKVGDTVKVVAIIQPDIRGINGWPPYWDAAMNDSLGKVMTVTRVDSRRESIELDNRNLFPAFVLEKVTSITLKLTNDYDIIVSPTKLNIGCQEVAVEKIQEVVDAARKLGVTIN